MVYYEKIKSMFHQYTVCQRTKRMSVLSDKLELKDSPEINSLKLLQRTRSLIQFVHTVNKSRWKACSCSPKHGANSSEVISLSETFFHPTTTSPDPRGNEPPWTRDITANCILQTWPLTVLLRHCKLRIVSCVSPLTVRRT